MCQQTRITTLWNFQNRPWTESIQICLGKSGVQGERVKAEDKWLCLQREGGEDEEEEAGVHSVRSVPELWHKNGYEIHKSLFCELTVHPSQQNQVFSITQHFHTGCRWITWIGSDSQHSCTCFGRAEERRWPSVSSVHSQRSGNTHLEQINTDCTLQKHSDQLLH